MRALVFGDGAARRQLEAILHPAIREEARARIARSDRPYVIVVVPLLLETGTYLDFTDRVLVVDCAEEEQVRRTSQRSGVTVEAARAIMAAQLPRAERIARADDVLSNTGGIEELRAGSPSSMQSTSGSHPDAVPRATRLYFDVLLNT